MKRALLSVTDKAELIPFAKALIELGYSLISTGGTARHLTDAGVALTPLERFTGWPEMLDGRVKTLHPKVHAGILARRHRPEDQQIMAEHALEFIDLVVVNLYDFQGALDKAASFEDTVEAIDIGGPTLLRAAAKNHPDVLPVVSPDDYPAVIEALKAGELSQAFRREMAFKVFAHTARYDALIAGYFQSMCATGEDSPSLIVNAYTRHQTLRYGENPHQKAAFYRPLGQALHGLPAAEQLGGKELSYNNILDVHAAFGLAVDLTTAHSKPACVYVKHNNPCGVALDCDLPVAIKKARAVDPVSAFGAVVAVNREVGLGAAQVLAETFLEVVIAPNFTPEALEVLKAKKNLRLLRLAEVKAWRAPERPGLEFRQVSGGALLQSRDEGPSLRQELSGAKPVTQRSPTEAEMAALQLAWVVAKHVRSNAIVFGAESEVLAVGAGQMSRVDSVKLCTIKAQKSLQGAAVASDAFFPFRDGVDVLAEAGATAIIQPGGSIRDAEVIEAANEHDIAMLFTGTRHFRH